MANLNLVIPYKSLLELASQSKNGVLMYYDLGKGIIKLDICTLHILEEKSIRQIPYGFSLSFPVIRKITIQYLRTMSYDLDLSSLSVSSNLKKRFISGIKYAAWQAFQNSRTSFVAIVR